MKKIDKLILKAFLGPFILTLLVVIFILLLQVMLRYFDEFFGKGLSFFVFLEMFFYFALNITPQALPLAILLSSLMTYGNLGEHNELTAIKASGISLTRTLLPTFIFSIFLMVGAFIFNNEIVPKANLKAYSLLYDIRQKKPTLDFKEGAFYKGLDGYSVKIDKKFPDGKSLKKLMIYDHTDNMGNTKVILADSGIMYTTFNDRYLNIEMFDGVIYSEVQSTNPQANKQFLRSAFKESNILFNLESFKLQKTREELFSSNKIMKNVTSLKNDIDSLKLQEENIQNELSASILPYYHFHSLPRFDTMEVISHIDTLPKFQNTTHRDTLNALHHAISNARSIKTLLESYKERLERNKQEFNLFSIEMNKKYAFSFACVVMFLIGAPLGAIIKKGGLGIPVILSIVFFIIFYIISITGEKWAKQGLMDPLYASWAANAVLLPIGLLFLKQARVDARLFDLDYYMVVYQKIFGKFSKKRK